MADTDWNAFSDVTSLLDTDTLLATRGGAGINFLAALLLFRSGGTVSGNLNVGGILTALAQGAEGGEIHLEKAPGSTLVGDIIFDTANQHLRIFEGAGTNRGVVIDLSACAAGAGSQLATIDTSQSFSNKSFNSAPIPAVSGSAPIFFLRAAAYAAGRATNGACTLNATRNIASITRTSTGVYDVVFTIAAPSANYIFNANGRVNGAMVAANEYGGAARTAAGFTLMFANTASGVALDPANFDISVTW